MTEFKRLQSKLGIKSIDCAKLFKVTDRTITRWRNGKVDAPESALMVLRGKVAGHE